MNKKIFFYILFLLSLMWLVLWTWSIAFHQKPWLSNFGVLSFVITGLMLGFIYFFTFYQFFTMARDIDKTWKRRMAYVALFGTLLFLSHWIIKGTFWVASWMGNGYGISFWLFVGFILSGFVLYAKDRLFSDIKRLFA